MNGDQDYVTVEQAARRLQVGVETVRRMLRDGRLEGVRLGGRRAGWRISSASLAHLLEHGPSDRPRVVAVSPLPVERQPAAAPPRSAAVGAALARAEHFRAVGDLEQAAYWEQQAASFAARRR